MPDWIQPAFARRYALRERAAAQTRQLYRQCDDVGLSMALNALAAFVPNLDASKIDTGKIFTNEFADNANKKYPNA